MSLTDTPGEDTFLCSQQGKRCQISTVESWWVNGRNWWPTSPPDHALLLLCYCDVIVMLLWCHGDVIVIVMAVTNINCEQLVGEWVGQIGQLSRACIVKALNNQNRIPSAAALEVAPKWKNSSQFLSRLHQIVWQTISFEEDAESRGCRELERAR